MKKISSISILALALLLVGCTTPTASSMTSFSSDSSSSGDSSSDVSSSQSLPSSSTASSSSSSSSASSSGESSSSESSSSESSSEASSSGGGFVNSSSGSYSFPDNPHEGEIIEFGRYPQECLNDPNDETATLPQGIENATDTDNDGYIEFDGKDYLKTLGSGEETYYSDGTTTSTRIAYDKATTYYFEVAPIKWEVMNDGTLLCLNIIDVSPYCSIRWSRTYNGETIEANNYEYSSVRAYLNGYDGSSYEMDDFSGIGFIDKAFTEQERSLIPTVTVDNSPATTHGKEDNPYASNNTEDKIFLLSYQDCLKAEYGFSTSFAESETRVKTHTDYALFKGLYYSYTPTGAAHWWTRSPSEGYIDQACNIHPSGFLYATGRVDPNFGLAPALKMAQ